MDKPKTFIVAVYDCDRAYGGPEEGGWWYNTGTLIRVCRVFKNQDMAYAWASRMNNKLKNKIIGPNVDKKYDISSVLSEGIYWAEVWEDRAPDHYPDRRPHYE